jgi:DNA mismatch endonuclease (patch repair protein)
MAELTPDDPRHGTTNGYGNLGCRCEPCRDANRRYHAEYRARRPAPADAPDAAHGTCYRYDVGCRCDECRAAHNAKSRATKQRLRERRLAEAPPVLQKGTWPAPLPPAPPPSAATASMKSNRSRDTKPELALRRALFALGRRYRVDAKIVLPQRAVRPDIVFAGARVAVFVDGCFWHGCPAHGRMPKDPTGYWHQKLARNISRDAQVTAALEAAGWRVVRVWEHVPLAGAVDVVQAALRGPG